VKRWISDSPEFQFDMSDIVRLREEMATLIERLSKIYTRKKEQKKNSKIAAKKKSEVEFVNGKDDNVDF